MSNVSSDHPVVEHTWKAPSVQTVVVLYVVSVFVGFIALAHFVFHSVEGVKALVLAAIGSVASLIPSTLARIEYRLTEVGLAKRPLRAKRQKEFRDVFSWDQLSHIVPTKTGFKFYKYVEEPSSFRRSIKLLFSGDLSGEFHVATEDRSRVRSMIDSHGIPASKPPSEGRVGSGSRF